MSSAPSPEEIARDARWLVQALDPAARVARLIEMDAGAYRAASFLDDRMLQRPVHAHLVPWEVAETAAAICTRQDARWIFHIGHVGSTLLARLLGELPQMVSIREPRLLRDISTIPAGERQPFTTAASKLLSRTFGADQLALVKATSFVSEIAPELVPSNGRALFMYAAPRAYVASILAGENSVQEQRLLAAARQQRSAGRVAGLRQLHNDAELAAAAWACEMTSLEQAAEAMTGREIAWMDFDAALGSMTTELSRAAAFFGLDASQQQVEELASGPLMTRYSKALEYEYSPGLRRELIEDAAQRHGGDIDRALAMLESASEKSPLLARALARSPTGEVNVQGH